MSRCLLLLVSSLLTITLSSATVQKEIHVAWYVFGKMPEDKIHVFQHPYYANYQTDLAKKGSDLNYHLHMQVRIIGASKKCSDGLDFQGTKVQIRKEADSSGGGNKTQGESLLVNLQPNNSQWMQVTDAMTLQVTDIDPSACANAQLEVVSSLHLPEESIGSCQSLMGFEEGFVCTAANFTGCMPTATLCRLDWCESFNAVCNQTKKGLLFRIALRAYPKLFIKDPEAAMRRAFYVYIILPVTLFFFVLSVIVVVIYKNHWRWVSKQRVIAFYSRSGDSAKFLYKGETVRPAEAPGSYRSSYQPIGGLTQTRLGSSNKKEERRELLREFDFD